jgi:transposase InsO family protein
MERVWQRHYANRSKARNDIADYFFNFYNCERLNSALGNLPPSVYERKMVAKEPIVVSENTWPQQPRLAWRRRTPAQTITVVLCQLTRRRE